MKKIFLAAGIIAFVVLSIYSCCKAGMDGKAEIVGSVYHHAKPIPGATIYIKFGVSEFPGPVTSNYDDSVTGPVNSNVVTIKNLHCGTYYLYGVGYDSAIYLPVTGGIKVQIKHSERDQQLKTNVPVTE